MKIKPIKPKAIDGTVLSLTIGREYEVLGIEADDFKILNDSDKKPYGNDPVLFDPECFEVTDATEPSFWVCSVGEDGERNVLDFSRTIMMEWKSLENSFGKIFGGNIR